MAQPPRVTDAPDRPTDKVRAEQLAADAKPGTTPADWTVPVSGDLTALPPAVLADAIAAADAARKPVGDELRRERRRRFDRQAEAIAAAVPDAARPGITGVRGGLGR